MSVASTRWALSRESCTTLRRLRVHSRQASYEKPLAGAEDTVVVGPAWALVL
jgi:hypothetical protein